jgi:hypothetical protein
LRSASLPPPISPSFVSQAEEASNISFVPENADASWSNQSLEQVDEPAIRANNPESIEAELSPPFSAEEAEGSEVLGSENLEPGSGSHDPLARGAVDSEFVTPTRYARNTYGSGSRSSLASNEQYFPAWFSDPQVGKSKNEMGFQWSDSSADDELPTINDLASQMGLLNNRLPIVRGYDPEFAAELRRLLDLESQYVLEGRMRRVNQLLPVDSESYSEAEDINSVAPEDGVQKNQRHSEDSHSHSRVLEVNVVDFAEVVDESGPKFMGSHAESYAENRAEGTSGIPYLAKGKYKAFSEDEGPSSEVADDAQIELDYKVALELEQRLNDEHRQMRKLEKKTRQMARKLQELRASNIAHEGSQSTPGVHKSKTPISLSDKAGRASSRLPAKSGLWRVMQGYGNRDSDLSSSSSTASESGGVRKAERKHDKAKDDATESGWSSDENIFHQEPESDHSSDSDATKRHKCEKHR